MTSTAMTIANGCHAHMCVQCVVCNLIIVILLKLRDVQDLFNLVVKNRHRPGRYAHQVQDSGTRNIPMLSHYPANLSQN